ncbi:probable carboxylesterase 17 [Punica granatum]|uniref:Alpha/beta hydrolase fold-3 domain-containing protein n=2 Tax=Punica granatum TaxID=22663 RepID=A0A218XI98_PUNGR|nr:probable carboxylesterase 17 [Punica granatum]OWM84663.1 hypothetical protein CDL15_Pgr027450 [Punica granatum]PKI69919.1 hypothetical protein CRG98_009794 [Punica granatum]
MAAVHLNQSFNQQLSQTCQKQAIVIEEIEGLIRVFKDGRVERPPTIPNVSCIESLDADVASRDVVIDKFTNLWARVYVPRRPGKFLPLLVYFHGGGFCIGSPAWSCYHEFLTTLASKANCVIISLNYRLAPENRLPAAYNDGQSALNWVRRVGSEGCSEHRWWLSHCNLSNTYLTGDSAGANIAYNVASRIGSAGPITPLALKGLILIQPFFGAEARTQSERLTDTQTPGSALTLAASDTYWRLSLPPGANRDHPWCNPLSSGTSALCSLSVLSVMVFVSELDILKDRNLHFCMALAQTGRKSVETVVCKGVGHAFQILHKSTLARTRTLELMSYIKVFIDH